MKFQDWIRKNGIFILAFSFFLIIFGFLLTIRFTDEEGLTGHRFMLGSIPIIIGTSVDTLTNVVVMMIIVLALYVFLWRK